MNKITIAIDGFSSSGKSTMARKLASDIGYRYIDSGAMYRAVTLWALRHGSVSNGTVDSETLTNCLPQIKIDFAPQSDGTQHTLLNGEDVEQQIRALDVSNNVSQVAAIPAVRHAMVALQQDMGKTKGIVMDGRDIGTTVFPEAEMKIFVDAGAETRAQRRYREMLDKGIDVNYDEILDNVKQRDYIDTHRDESPLRKAPDAISLDNSNMTKEQQNQWLLKRFNSIVNGENRD